MVRSRVRTEVLALLGTLIMLQGCGQAASVEPDRPDAGSELLFREVAEEAGLGDFVHETGAFGAKWFPETVGAGGAFLDYNGDDWADILLVGGGMWSEDDPVQALRLYRNERDGTFTDVTQEAGLEGIQAYGFGIAAADYDNDGDADFLLTTLHQNLLFRNERGHFNEVGQQAGIAGERMWSTSAIFFDGDRDGWLDLFVGNYVVWSPEQDIFCAVDGTTKSYCQPTLYKGQPSNFYRNNGDGTFTERSAAAGFTDMPGKTLGVAEFDYNGDGWSDLVVANDMERDLLFENDGDGTFSEKGVLSGVAYDEDGTARSGMGIDTGVVDSTGRETIFVGNFSNEMIGVYRYRGNGLFRDRAAASKIGRPSLLKVTFGLFVLDVELDGDLDLFVANGHIREENDVQNEVPYRQEAQLFINRGNGDFALHVPSSDDALSEAVVGRGAAYADYDRDGDLDILLTENGGPARLWRNESKGRHALRVHVRGGKSNRDGLNAQIEVTVGDLRMHRRIRTGSSYLSQSEKVATFGLGSKEQVDTLLIRWPSGRVDRFANVKAPQEIRVVEGEASYEPLSRAPQQMIGDATP